MLGLKKVVASEKKKKHGDKNSYALMRARVLGGRNGTDGGVRAGEWERC